MELEQIKDLIKNSNFSTTEKIHLLKYLENMEIELDTNDLGKAFGYIKKQNLVLKLEIEDLKREIRNLKELTW